MWNIIDLSVFIICVMMSHSVVNEIVRSKVSSWLSGIVDEVRRKSPARLQKWSESTDSSRTLVTVNDEKKFEETPTLPQNISRNAIQEEVSGEGEVTVSDDGGSSRPWRPGVVLSKVRAFERLQSNHEDSRISIDGIKSIGRAKINELYEKVRANRVRFNNLKGQSTMDQPVMNVTELDISENRTDDENEGGLLSTHCSFNNTNLESSLNDDLEISENNDSFSPTRKMPLAAIGRSSTSCSSSNSASQVQVIPKHKPPKSPILSNKAQKHLLGNIGRSFSEQNDDENDSIFMLNERSRSYSHVVGEREQPIKTAPRDTENNNVSCSLPTFFGPKSVPVSPVPLHKGIISQEASLSDSSRRKSLLRDGSFQSDSSHCSSVESLLEARKPDPEAILVNLGFGPIQSEDVLTKIPKRFLKPSQVKGIDIDTFLRQQQMANHLHDHSVLGYRGLLGNPDIPPSLIVAKIMERFEQNERNRCIMDINLNRPQSAPPTPGPNQ